MESLNGEEFGILLHTQKNGRFNGGDSVTASLAERGYLKNIGQPSWVPEPYYTLTEKGREFLRSFQDPNKLSMTL